MFYERPGLVFVAEHLPQISATELAVRWSRFARARIRAASFATIHPLRLRVQESMFRNSIRQHVLTLSVTHRYQAAPADIRNASPVIPTASSRHRNATRAATSLGAIIRF